MSHPFCSNPVVLQRLYACPLGAHIDTFAQQLLAQGYARSTAKYTMRLLVALSSWLQQHALSPADLNEQRVEAFLQHRYRRCRPNRSDRSILRRLLTQLRDHGVTPVPVVETDTSACNRIACDFQHYLLHQRCLAPTTVGDYLDTVRHFLRERCGTQPLRLEALQPQDITRFMVQQARRYSPARAKLIATALRSFFRFLLQRGAIANDLAKAVPTVPNWRLSTLPKFMNADDVACLLRSCDRHTLQGQRDYAILLLLVRLGFRAGEVAALPLDDLDWEAGELLVRSKGARQDRLPLPHDVGDAFVAYLRNSRPPSATRQVFVRMRAPRRGFADGQAVGTIVRRALVRAGLNPALKGAHLLRHSLATQLLQDGASLAEIGELLRHRNIETTRIYAKVDQGALRTLALPWPGGVT
ncbi:MAG: tyrosine-type recombinase/integrase [Acidiferrobacterales bacterium]